MKFLKLFKQRAELGVAEICKKYYIENWSINKDGLVDVDGNVNILSQNITKLPLRFGKVTGDFFCYKNKLTTLEGAPKEVGGNFSCHDNELTTLEGAPKEVRGDFYCSHNNLTTLEGAPKEVGGNFYCYMNKLITLKWAPEYIAGKVDFLPNDNLPKEFLYFLRLNTHPHRSDNLEVLQKYILKWQKDYAVWRKDGSFNQANFIQMMEAAQDALQNIKFTK